MSKVIDLNEFRASRQVKSSEEHIHRFTLTRDADHFILKCDDDLTPEVLLHLSEDMRVVARSLYQDYLEAKEHRGCRVMVGLLVAENGSASIWVHDDCNTVEDKEWAIDTINDTLNTPGVFLVEHDD